MLIRIIALCAIAGIVLWVVVLRKKTNSNSDGEAAAAAVAATSASVPIGPNPPIRSTTEPRFVGCFKDGDTRTMDIAAGQPIFMTHDDCHQFAVRTGKKYFATQYTQPDGTARCFTAPAGDASLQRIKQLGSTDNCKMMNNNRVQGKEWSNAVYEI